MKKYRAGIVGVGFVGKIHLETVRRLGCVEVVAIADKFLAKEVAEQWGVPNYFEDYKEMIDTLDLDMVHVCTPNSSHYEVSMYALEHGINVLLEKPFSVTTEEAVAMMRAEKKSGKILSIGFQPRGDENMQMIKKVVQSGVLGKIYYIQTGGGRRRGIPNSTFIEKSTGGIGALGDIGCYSLDVVLNAIGYPKPLTVTGYKSDFFGKNPKYATPDKFHTAEENAARFSVDDFAAAFVRLEGDIILDFRISWAMHPDTPGDTIIFGTEGGLRIPSTDCWNGTFTSPMTLYHDLAGERVQTTIPLIPHKGPGLFDIKIRSFLDAIKYNRPAPVPSSEIIYNQAIIDSICKSAELGHEIKVEIPEI